jgi:quercetin dioxygenase-like cupin family protein
MENHKETLFRETDEQFIILGNLVTLLVTGEDTVGKYAIFEDIAPPLAGPPPHTHPDQEIFFVVSGNFEFVIDDLTKPFRTKPGDVVKVPSNALHTYKNVGQTAGKLLTILSPGKLEDYFRAIGIPVTSANDIPDLSQSPDILNMDVTRAFALASEHHVTFFLSDMVK